MALKGTIFNDHIQRNSFELKINSVGTLNIISVGSLEQELSAVTLPDRRAATGGVTDPIQVDVETPMHHLTEQAIWETWYALSKRPQIIVASYKYTATLLCYASTGGLPFNDPRIAYELTGVFPMKRSTTDFDMTNEGEDARVTWTLSIDSVFPTTFEPSTIGGLNTGVQIIDNLIDFSA